jgi:transposase InsO family protein
MFIREHKDMFAVRLMCEVLGVCKSAYYGWLKHVPCKREQQNRVLDVTIKTLFMEHKGRYGAPRMTLALNKIAISCSKQRVANRMKVLNLRAKAKKKFRVTTDSEHSHPVFENILDRDFSANAINQKWAGDITYISTKEGWLYLAVVIDLFSRSVIGWSMSKSLKKNLVCDSLTMALFRRKFPKKVIVHSDRGSQYCSKDYKKILQQNDLIGSMSRKGNCWDNAASESFFHTLKVELIHGRSFETRAEAKQQIFNYIESYYNKKRMHSSIDYKTPHEMECA